MTVSARREPAALPLERGQRAAGVGWGVVSRREVRAVSEGPARVSASAQESCGFLSFALSFTNFFKFYSFFALAQPNKNGPFI